MSMQLYPHISADGSILSGQPVIEGTSVAVGLVVAQIAAGKSLDDVAHEHGITIEDVRAALEYAARRASEPIAAVRPADEAGSAAGRAAERPFVEDEARQLGLDPAELSPLGRRLLELRAQGIAAGEPPIATWEELDAEIAERRGGAYPDTDE